MGRYDDEDLESLMQEAPGGHVSEVDQSHVDSSYRKKLESRKPVDPESGNAGGPMRLGGTPRGQGPSRAERREANSAGSLAPAAPQDRARDDRRVPGAYEMAQRIKYGSAVHVGAKRTREIDNEMHARGLAASTDATAWARHSAKDELGQTLAPKEGSRANEPEYKPRHKK